MMLTLLTRMPHGSERMLFASTMFISFLFLFSPPCEAFLQRPMHCQKKEFPSFSSITTTTTTTTTIQSKATTTQIHQAAGGFGSSPTKSQSKKNKKTKTGGGGFGGKTKTTAGGTSAAKAKTKKNKRQSSLLQELDSPQDTLTASAESEPVLLDKWGLPPPTLEDIFPPLHENTELIAVTQSLEHDNDEEHQQRLIQEALQGYLPCLGPRIQETFFSKNDKDKTTEDDSQTTSTMQLKLMHQSPPVLVIENFLTPQECRDIEAVVGIGSSESEDSTTTDNNNAVQVNSATFQHAQSTRTSTSWFTFYHKVPTLLAKFQHWLGIPLAQMEEPQIVRYQPQQEFSWHYDEVPPNQLNNGGQRLATILVYLNDVPPGGGGGTMFRDLKEPTTTTSSQQQQEPLTVQPRQGRALIFFPATADGRPDDRTLHQGQVLAEGQEKRIIQVWIHQDAYTAVLPPGNLQSAAQTAVAQAARELKYTS